MLYRVFPWSPGAGPADLGGPLYVPRLDQGSGRHDNPEVYGALYLSRAAVSPVAERLRVLRGRTVTEAHFRREGARLSLAEIDDAPLARLLDLDEPRRLSERALRPSTVATRQRDLTQPIALAIWDEGAPGFEWWSTIEGSWINVTLFAERAVDRLQVRAEPEPLTVDHPVVREAADAVGVLLR